MSLPDYLQPRVGGTQITVKVQPRASRHAIAEPLGGVLKIRIAAPPVDSAANDALIKFLSDTLGCPRSQVQLIRGGTSRNKILFVQSMTPREVAAKLAV